MPAGIPSDRGIQDGWLTMKIYSGTSGYGYKEWKGNFYPDKISPKEMLRFYAERFQTVEINNTFYRLPTGGVLASWAEQVPDDFIFAFKAPQKITHLKRLRNVGEETGYLFRSLSILERKLGPVLFQFPKSFSSGPPGSGSFSRSDSRPYVLCLRVSQPLLAPGGNSGSPSRKGLQSLCMPIRMRTRPKRSSLRPPGGTCACAVPITPMPICPSGWKESFRKNGRRPSFFLNTRMKRWGPNWRTVFRNWPIPPGSNAQQKKSGEAPRRPSAR